MRLAFVHAHHHDPKEELLALRLAANSDLTLELALL